MNEFDGGGRLIWPALHKYLLSRRIMAPQALEAFAGEGWWGINLVSAKIAGTVTLSEIRRAKPAQRELALQRGVADSVFLHQGDMMAGLDRKFDLIVANPPSYKWVNRDHPDFGALRGLTICCEDVAWELHRRFYQRVPELLALAGDVIVMEVEPFLKTVEIAGVPYDERGVAPHVEFLDLINAAGLEHVATTRIFNVPTSAETDATVGVYLMHSREMTVRLEGVV